MLVTQSCLTLRPHGLQPTRLLCPWDFPGTDTKVGCHFLLQGILPTQGSNPGLLHCRQILYRLSYKGSYLSYIHTYIYTYVCVFICIYVHIYLHTYIHLVLLGTCGAVVSVVLTDAVLTTNVGRILRAGWRAERRALVAVGGPDPQASKEFGLFGVLLLDQIIRQ